MQIQHDAMTLFKELNASLSSIEGRIVTVSTAHNAAFIAITSAAIGGKLYKENHFMLFCACLASFTFINMIIIQRLHCLKMECIASMQEIWSNISSDEKYSKFFPSWLTAKNSGGAVGLSFTIMAILLIALFSTIFIMAYVAFPNYKANYGYMLFCGAMAINTIRLYAKFFVGKYEKT